jgi:hypothetical protein
VAQVGVIGAEAQLSLGAAELRFDNGGDGGGGFVVNRQLDRVVTRMGDELRGCVFDHAFFGFPFFFGDFSAELYVFFVFDRAAVFFVFAFRFVGFFAFRLFGFFFGRGWGFAGQPGQGQRVRRGGRDQQREQQEDEQEGELAHLPFIGTAPGPL